MPSIKLLLALCTVGLLGEGAPIELNPPRGPLPPVIQSDQGEFDRLITGYDCNTTAPEVLTLSTLDVGPCDIVIPTAMKNRSYNAQIVQRRTIRPVRIFSCLALKSDSYTHCGMHSHSSGVHPSSSLRPSHVTPQQCREALQTKALRGFNGRSVSLDSLNTTLRFHQPKAGWFGPDGSCEGGNVMIAGRLARNIVHYEEWHIKFRESYGQVDIDTRALNIMGEVKCPYGAGWCADDETGVHVWDVETLACEKDQYDILYTGKVYETEDPEMRVRTITIIKDNYLLYSVLGFRATLCGHSGYNLDYLDLYLIPQEHDIYVFDSKLTHGTPQVNLLTYVNSKVSFAYHDIYTCLRATYRELVLHMCNLERKMLKNRIELIRQSTYEGGLGGLGYPGSYVKVSGEVMHIIKCTPVVVTLREATECYKSLPVMYMGAPVFLLPQSRIIVHDSARIPCSSVTPTMFNLRGEWIEMTPMYRTANAPKTMKPVNYTNMPFKRIRTFAQGVIYSEKDVQATQHAIMFPSLRDAVVSDMVSTFTSTGYQTKLGNDIRQEPRIEDLVVTVGLPQYRKRTAEKNLGKCRWKE
ncbi:K02A2.6-like [Cordylochernes scorpioides]|uniref:K02A2.6-like n=1 Tax=Cordylochernes scorpioides TaxID=51811 RepID=A0ABY6LR61_9ARAC|nr:K02A2.6-like [Cordylochernes scorpioides]